MKKCKYDANIRCFWFSCDFIDYFGNVRVCKHHLNPFGRNRGRIIKCDLRRER